MFKTWFVKAVPEIHEKNNSLMESISAFSDKETTSIHLERHCPLPLFSSASLRSVDPVIYLKRAIGEKKSLLGDGGGGGHFL